MPAMKNIAVSILSLSFLFCTPAVAQETSQTTEPADEVISLGTVQRDKAMAAFLSGDFATAEVEFKRNAFCALRAARNLRAGIEAAADSTIRADVGVDANIPAQPTGGPGGAAPTPTAPTAVPTARLNGSNFTKNESIASRTCEDRGYQLYMAGVSQLQLGKIKEAEDSFKRAIVLRKSIYDAYFRLSLLEYQNGDIKAAKKQFKRLRALQKKCRNCEAEKEIAEQVAYLRNLLG